MHGGCDVEFSELFIEIKIMKIIGPLLLPSLLVACVATELEMPSSASNYASSLSTASASSLADVQSSMVQHSSISAASSTSAPSSAIASISSSAKSLSSAKSSSSSSARSSVSPAQSTDLIHPGILHIQKDLDSIKASIQAAKQPWLNAFNQMKASDKASLKYTPHPFAIVECGSYNMPNVGCNDINNDGTAAYTHALMFVLTGDPRYADKAKAILAEWASTYDKNTDSNARLVVAWAAPFFANAGELLKIYDETWSKSEIQNFTRLLDKFLPYVKNDARPENNWIWSRIEAHMAIAVFKDDKAEFEIAIERWQRYLPTYIYYKAEDGSAPVKTPFQDTASTLSKWMAKKFYDGQSMETCRDLGHMDLGFRSMLNAAEIAWSQGVDLFKPNSQRMTRFMELHGQWMTGAQTPPADMCPDGFVRAVRADNAGIKAPDGGGRQAWEIAYKHFGDRLKIRLPYTQQMLLEGRPTGVARWVRKWETLAFANMNFTDFQSTNNRPPYVQITMPVDGEMFQYGQSIYVLADVIDSDAGDRVSKTTIRIDGVLGRSEVNPPYEWGHGGTPAPDETRLPIGRHRIAVIAEDMHGTQATNEITIEVVAP